MQIKLTHGDWVQIECMDRHTQGMPDGTASLSGWTLAMLKGTIFIEALGPRAHVKSGPMNRQQTRSVRSYRPLVVQ